MKKLLSRKELLFLYYWSVFVFSCIVIINLSSCATIGSGEKALSPKQQSVVWMSLYNQQYKETQSAMLTLIMTPSQERQAYYSEKVKILTELWPALKDYDDIANSGGTPSQQMTMAVSYLVYRLTDLIVGGVK